MPLYEYQCESCDRKFEKIVKFSDPPLEKCPTCGGPVRKLVSSPAFHLKGTGWYATDYAKKDQAPADKTESSRDEKDSKDGKGEKDTKDTKDAKDTKDTKDTKDSKTSTSDTAPGSASATTSTTPKGSD
jgi:putative FmdB family regulatory protein